MAELAGIPPAAVMEGDTAQALADAAAMRERMAPLGVPRGPGEDFALQMGALTAAMLAGEFPGLPGLGRIAASVTQALQSVLQASDESAIDIGPHGLLVVGMLAGEQLDREASDDA